MSEPDRPEEEGASELETGGCDLGREGGDVQGEGDAPEPGRGARSASYAQLDLGLKQPLTLLLSPWDRGDPLGSLTEYRQNLMAVVTAYRQLGVPKHLLSNALHAILTRMGK